MPSLAFPVPPDILFSMPSEEAVAQVKRDASEAGMFLSFAIVDAKYARETKNKKLAMQAQDRASHAKQLLIKHRFVVEQIEPENLPAWDRLILACDSVYADMSVLLEELGILKVERPTKGAQDPAERQKKANKEADKLARGDFMHYLTTYWYAWAGLGLVGAFTIGNKMKWWSPPKWTPKLLK